MRVFLSILAAAVISSSIAAPVNQSSDLEQKVLLALSYLGSEYLTEISQWRALVKRGGASTFSDKDTLLPRVKKCFEIIDTLLQRSDLIGKLTSTVKYLKILLGYNVSDLTSIVESHRSFEDETVRFDALHHFEFFNLVQVFQLKCKYYELYHHLRNDLLQLKLTLMHEGAALMRDKEQGKLLSILYKHKISAEEKMFLDIQRLLKSLPSFEQIDQFITSFETYSDVFKDPSISVFRIEGESRARLNKDSASETASSSNPQNERDDLSCSIPDSITNPEPSSKRRKFNNDFPNIFGDSNPTKELVLSAFPRLILDPTVDIKKKLENWKKFVKTNQPIDTSELLITLKDCINVMKSIEMFIPYSSFLNDELDESFNLALQTADGFHDFLKVAALLVLPRDYFVGLMGPLQEESHLANPILPKDFFEETIFIEFCIHYSHLLLQNNCHKLRGKTVSMINLKNFADRNRPYVDLILFYQALLELRYENQTATEKQKGISYDLKARANTKVNKSIVSFLEGPMRPVEDFETFLDANKELMNMIMVEDSAMDGDGTFWMVQHVTTLIDLQPMDIDLSSDDSPYVYYDPGAVEFESRRLYNLADPSGSDSGHILSRPSN